MSSSPKPIHPKPGSMPGSSWVAKKRNKHDSSDLPRQVSHFVTQEYNNAVANPKSKCLYSNTNIVEIGWTDGFLYPLSVTFTFRCVKNNFLGWWGWLFYCWTLNWTRSEILFDGLSVMWLRIKCIYVAIAHELSALAGVTWRSMWHR